VDENLKTFLLPEFVDRHQLQFAVNFPASGNYKLWFTFRDANQINRLEYIVHVQ
jgi:hypothetical protein